MGPRVEQPARFTSALQIPELTAIILHYAMYAEEAERKLTDDLAHFYRRPHSRGFVPEPPKPTPVYYDDYSFDSEHDSSPAPASAPGISNYSAEYSGGGSYSRRRRLLLRRRRQAHHPAFQTLIEELKTLEA